MITEMREFGRHVCRLRRERGFTQESFAVRAGLSADTIGRIETGRMSPTLITLRRLCRGLGLSLSALFDGLELDDQERIAELLGMLRGRPDADVVLATRLVRVVLLGVDVLRPRDDGDDDMGD